MTIAQRRLTFVTLLVLTAATVGCAPSTGAPGTPPLAGGDGGTDEDWLDEGWQDDEWIDDGLGFDEDCVDDEHQTCEPEEEEFSGTGRPGRPVFTKQQVNRAPARATGRLRSRREVGECRPDAQTRRVCSDRITASLSFDSGPGQQVQRACRGGEAVYVCRKLQQLMSLGNNRRLRVHYAGSGAPRVRGCDNRRGNERATTDFNDSYAAHNRGDRSRTAEHIYDLQFGGQNGIGNLVALSRECNSALGRFMSSAPARNVATGAGVDLNQCLGAEVRLERDPSSATLQAFCGALGVALP